MSPLQYCDVCSVLLFRLQNTDLSQSCTQSKKQADMDETKEDSGQHAEVVNI